MYVAARWHAVPERFPVHWDLAGRANGWGTRSIAGVFAPAMVSTAICLIMLWVTRRIRRTARVPPGHVALRLGTLVVLAISYVTAVIAAAATITMPFSRADSSNGLFAIAAGAVIVTLTAFLTAARRALRSDGSPGGPPDDGWKWGLIYDNPADPSLWVPKRVGIGWTINLGHPWGWPMLIVVFGGSLVLIAAVTIAVSRPR
jgi:uncharacterized membrane protein